MWQTSSFDQGMMLLDGEVVSDIFTIILLSTAFTSKLIYESFNSLMRAADISPLRLFSRP